MLVRESVRKTRSPRVRTLERRRLLGLLAGDAEVPVVVISASAGSGKSILAAQWSAPCQRPIALLSLETSDNGPAVLLAAELREELSRSLAVLYGMAQRPRGRRKGTDVRAEAEAG